MAGLAATASQAYRANGIGTFDADENRKQSMGLISAALDSTNAANSIISPEVEGLMANNTYGVEKQIIVLNRDNSPAGTTRSCTINGAESVSALYTLQKATAVKDVTVYPSVYGQNDVSMIDDVTKKMRDAEYALAQLVEDGIYTAMVANVNEDYNSSFVSGAAAIFPLSAGNFMQVDAVYQDFFFNHLPSIMMSDNRDYARDIQVVASPELMPFIAKYGNQGAANAINTEYQYRGFDFNYSNSFAVNQGESASAIAFPLGQLGLLYQNTPDSVRNASAGDGSNWYTTVMPDNVLGTPVSVLEKSTCADASTLGTAPVGLEATERIDMQFSVDYYILTPYSSVATESPYYGFDYA